MDIAQREIQYDCRKLYGLFEQTSIGKETDSHIQDAIYKVLSV